MKKLLRTARAAALPLLRKLLPRPVKRYLKRFWDPNQVITEQEATLLAERLVEEGFFDPSGLELAAGGARPSRYDVISFSIIDWDFRWQRPQQIMSAFADAGHRVFYLSTSRFLPPRKGPFAARRLRDNVWEILLATPRSFDVYSGELRAEVLSAIANDLDSLRKQFHISSAVSIVQVATWTSAALEARRRFGWRLVYDCMDEWDNFPGMASKLLSEEQLLIREADLLVVSGQQLWDKHSPLNSNSVLARNATDFEHFHNPPPNDLLSDVSGPVIGYFGAIAEWFDLALVESLAAKRPEWTFVLIGGIFNVDVKGLEALPNVRVLGQKPYELMPAYLQHFDVCMIPFQVNAITEATDPVKFYEYVSQGKPVVATRMPELFPYRDHLYIADDEEDFMAKLESALQERDPAAVERRIELARQNTWTNRVDAVREGIRKAYPRASVVIVTYNNLHYNKLCLGSVLRNTLHPNYEVIIVDNASSDGTPEYLKALAEDHEHVHVILNDENFGFARANNQGLERASGERLVLLNNDTVVPNGWLTRLLRHLEIPEIGLVNSVTNFSGNESKIPVTYTDLDSMEDFAEAYTDAHGGRFFDIRVAAMYCVAMRRDAYEKVGPLDEQFGMGMFEDDDYSHRMRLAGYRVVCVEDAFVHHFGQASFKKLSQAEYQAIWDRNQKIYEEKWGIEWQAHTHRS